MNSKCEKITRMLTKRGWNWMHFVLAHGDDSSFQEDCAVIEETENNDKLKNE